MPFCEKFHVATGGESCEDSAKSYSVAVDLAALNPEVNCEKLPAGEILCAKMHSRPI